MSVCQIVKVGEENRICRIEGTEDLCESRRQMYLFLSRVFACEIDEATLRKLRILCAVFAKEEDGLAKTYQMIARDIDGPESDMIIRLAEDYARVFLGAGLSPEQAAYPYASVYTSEKRLIMQDIRDHIAEAYGKRQIELAGVSSEHMEDHISCELQYMAYLCECEKEEGQSVRREQLEFSARYLRNWVPAFCRDVKSTAKTGFYQGMAELLEKYLEADHFFLT